MQYKITKLDARYSFKDKYTYLIEFSQLSWGNGTGVLDFDRSRRWFNQAFGWSQEVVIQKDIQLIKLDPSRTEHVNDNDVNTNWAYSTEYRDYRIYVKDSSVLNWFVLSHPNEA